MQQSVLTITKLRQDFPSQTEEIIFLEFDLLGYHLLEKFIGQACSINNMRQEFSVILNGTQKIGCSIGFVIFLSSYFFASGIKILGIAALNDPDGYTIVMPDGTEFTILPGAVVDFVAEGFNNVTTFNLTGISEDLMIDPDDATTFVGGFLFSGIGQGSSIAQTALTIDTDAPPPVPLPAGVWFLLTGVAGFGLASRRKSAAA